MSRPLRVAMISHGYPPLIGGAERQPGAIAPALQKQGIELHVLTRRFEGLNRFETMEGVRIHRLPIPGPKPMASLTFTVTALALLSQLHPDVIHAHELISPATTAVGAKRALGVPIVITPHSCGVNGDVTRLRHKPLGKSRIALLRREVDAFVVINREIDQELAAMGVPRERRHFIPNGVDTQRFAPLPSDAKRLLRDALDLPDVPIAVYAGRLVPEKRIDQLIEIWPEVRKAHPQALLLLIGAGRSEDALKRIAGEGMRFVGIIQDVVPYLQAADLFLLPSASEALSVALLEAMSAGLATIATAVGGNLDLIAHGDNGWLVPVEGAPSLQRAVVTLLNDREFRTNLGCRARARVIRDYELTHIAKQLGELYQRLVASRNG